MNKIFLVFWLTLGAILVGCSSEEPILPPEVEEPAPVYGAELHAAPVTLFLPYVTTTTLWGAVLGEPESVKLYLDGELYGQSPDATFTASEPGTWQFVLEVVYDSEHTITRAVTITATTEVVEPDSPLEGIMTVVPNGLIAPFESTIALYAWGGTLPYAFEIAVDGEVYTEPTVHFVAGQPGKYPVIGIVTDADGNSVTFTDVIQVHAPDALPVLTAAAFGSPQNSHAPVTATLGVFPSGGDGDYHFFWYYGDDLFSTEQFPVYPDLVAGEHVFTVCVEDGIGNEASDNITITVLDPVVEEPDPLEIDATASTSNIPVPFSTTLDVDVFGGTLPYTFEWRYGGSGEVIATTKSIELLIADVGSHQYLVTVTDAHGQTLTEQVYVIGLSPESDDPDPLTVTATAAPSELMVPFVTTLDADPLGGTLPYSYQWWHDGVLVGTTQSISYSIGEAEEYEFTVIVTDALDQTAEANVTVTGLEPPGTEVITWQVDTDLKVGPLDAKDSETVVTGQTGWNRIWFYLKFDVELDERSDVIVEFVYSDGTRRYWTIPDLITSRPAYVLVDGGEALVEPSLQVKFYFEDGIYGRDSECSNWDYLLRIHGSREIPLGYHRSEILQVQSTTFAPTP